LRTKSILALDTASPAPAVTLLSGSRRHDVEIPADRQASERLLSAIEACFAAMGESLADCGRIAVCSGPGSFTGVRVGLATAWGLGRALGCPVEPVPTLEAIAEAARVAGLARVAAALDAGRGEIVWQSFDLSGPRARALGPAVRESVDAARAAKLPFAAIPRDLLSFAAVEIDAPLSKAVAEAVAREPGPVSGSFAAIYSRPSAAEEKLGAP
jgi:tRNA threonylcarbamoyladenosine biosynthesis protein TsaB